MNHVAMYRGWALMQMQEMIAVYEHFANTLSAEDATTYRDGGDGWTVAEVMCHLRDFEGIFMERATLTVEQENPPLPFPNPDELAKANNYAAESLAAAYAVWAQQRETHLAYYASLNDDAWARPAVHPKRGTFTLNDQLMLTARHDVLHLNQMMKILAQRES